MSGSEPQKNRVDDQERPPTDPLVLSFFIAVAWMGTNLVMVLLGGVAGSPVAGATVAPIASVLAAMAVDRRMSAGAQPLRWRAPDGLTLSLGALAAVGALILASELNNIAESLFPSPPMEAPAEQPPPVHPALVVVVVTASMVGMSIVFNGLIVRQLLGRFRPGVTIAAVAIWAGVMASGTGHPLSLVGPLFALGAWFYVHTRSVTMAAVSVLPIPLLLAASFLGLAPNLPGFDVQSPDRILYQPVWFDLLGAALVAVGVGGLMRRFNAAEGA